MSSPGEYLLQELYILLHHQSPANVEEFPGQKDMKQEDADDTIDKIEEQTEHVAKCIFLGQK